MRILSAMILGVLIPSWMVLETRYGRPLMIARFVFGKRLQRVCGIAKKGALDTTAFQILSGLAPAASTLTPIIPAIHTPLIISL
jgi:hypothetical protein